MLPLALLPIAFSSCTRTAAAIPRGIAGTLTEDASIKAIIKALDPDAEVRGGQSGGGGYSGTKSIWGSDIEASYEYMYLARVQSTKKLDEIVRALETGLRSSIKDAGAKPVSGSTGGSRTGRETLDGPLKTLFAAKSLTYKLNGYQGDVFLVAYPIKYPIPNTRNFEVIVRAIEVLVDK